MKYLIAIIVTIGLVLTGSEVIANSHGSYASARTPVRTLLGVNRRIERRQTRRAVRQAGWGSAGSTSYSSAGSTSYGSAGKTSYATPVVVEDIED